MLYTYSVTPLFEDHFEETVRDLVDQYKRKISSCPMFIMKIHAEGTPPWSKARRQSEIYRRYKERLDAVGVPSGVLLQSTLGHGYSGLAPSPFAHIETLDGKISTANCPMDEGLLDHLSNEIRIIAETHPKALMLDDDFRLVLRSGHGCVCPRHMAELNRRLGTSFTKESLREHLFSVDGSDPVARAFTLLQRETLVHAATRFREAVDSVDPTIQGINCTSGDTCESVIYTAPIWCGKGNPTIVRTPNGTYAPITVKAFSDTMRRAAVSGARLRDNGIDVILAECDTIPFNRYGKNARYLHAHYAFSLLEGLSGSKHWITRTSAYEPTAGIAFREILAKHAGLYERISELARDLRFVGACSVFAESKTFDFSAQNVWHPSSSTWASKVFERLGLPFYFSNKRYGAAFLEGEIGRLLTDDEIKAILDSGSVFMTAEVARALEKRGYGEYLGVTVGDAVSGRIGSEAYDDADELVTAVQKNPSMLEPRSERIEILSRNVRYDDGVSVDVSPAVTRFDRGNQKYSVVFCGTPDVQHNYIEGFSFLCETRKQQLISLLRDAGALPIYLPSDNELCLRAGYLGDGRLLAAILNLSYDPEERVRLYLEREPKSIAYLDENGEETAVPFKSTGDRFYELDTAAEPLYPLFLIIKS